MSRKANCWDNAPTESLVATIKKELLHHEHYATREAASRSLFEYIEVFYRRQRRHSALAYQTPEAVHNNWNREEGRGGLEERGLVSPKSKNNCGAAAPRITKPLTSAHFLWRSPKTKSCSIQYICECCFVTFVSFVTSCSRCSVNLRKSAQSADRFLPDPLRALRAL
jgi:Integrase core domain